MKLSSVSALASLEAVLTDTVAAITHFGGTFSRAGNSVRFEQFKQYTHGPSAAAHWTRGDVSP